MSGKVLHKDLIYHDCNNSNTFKFLHALVTLGTVVEIRHIPNLFYPLHWFSDYSVCLIIFSKMEPFLNIISDLPIQERATIATLLFKE